MSRFAVIYAVVVEINDAEGYGGVFLDYPFIGGITDTPGQAEDLARSLSEDKSIPGTVFAKVCDMNSSGLEHARDVACRQFSQQAKAMYDVEEQQQRREKRRK